MGFGLQNYGGFLTVQWPIFTGFGEENKVRLADTQRQAAVEELSLAKEKTIAEVWRAYTRAKNALARRESADGLVKATRASYDAPRRIRSGAGARSRRADGASRVVASHRAAGGIGQRHRSDPRSAGLRLRQARRRYPPRPIATPVSSAPTSTIVHPSSTGRWPVLRPKR